MWMTCALLTALSTAPAQPSTLQLTNVRATNGLLGPVRTETKVLPGDVFVVAFDIDGLSVDERGKAVYSLEVEFKNAAGRVQLQNKFDKIEAFLPLGGNRLPAEAHGEVGTQTAPGKYTMTVTVADLKSNQKQSLSRDFEVLAPGFGIVRAQLTYEGSGVPAPPGGVVGQVLAANCLIMGFQRDDKTKNPNLIVEVRIVDAAGNPTTPKPQTQVFKEAAAGTNYLDLHFPVELNRAGKFTIELKVTDEAGKKNTTLQIPITVVDTTK